MSWIGTWRNQYGSTLVVTGDRDGRIEGAFRTALRDSAFFGHELPVTGAWFDDCVNFTFGLTGEGQVTICAFTGMLREDRLQTVWHVVTSARPNPAGQPQRLGWAHAVQTNADTFERVE